MCESSKGTCSLKLVGLYSEPIKVNVVVTKRCLFSFVAPKICLGYKKNSVLDYAFTMQQNDIHCLGRLVLTFI